MTSLYEVLKRSKTAPQLAPDMFTALWAKSIAAGKIIELSGQVPLSFKANGEPLLDYLISGNTVQTGTPTPDSPVMPQGAGDKTTNEWNVTILPNSAITEDSKWQKYDSGVVSTTMYMSCEANTTYYLYTPSSITSGIFRVYTSTSNEIPIVGSYSITVYEKIRSSSPMSVFKFTTGANDKIIIVQVTTANSQTMADNAILDRGYKIPISSGGVTTNIYLGSTQTTRQIKKYEMTGNEIISNYASDFQRYVITIPTISSLGTRLTPIICSHYTGIYDGRPAEQVPMNAVYTGSATDNSVLIKTDQTTDRNTFIAWLQEQYANGTPVTLWYVISTPETGIVNEPLCKIGDYADTLSMEQAGVQIPTNNGSTTLDVLTAVKPSNVSIKYRV